MLRTKVEPMRVFLDALVAMRWLDRTRSRYRNSPDAAACLVAGETGYVGHFGIVEHESWDLWSGLLDLLRTGRAPRSRGHRGERTFHLLTGLHELGVAAASRLVAKLRLGGATRLLDAGGGLGTYALAAAGRHPGLRVTVVDRPSVLRTARPIVAAAREAARIRLFSGDLLRGGLPTGHDAALVSNVLHFLTPGECVRALRHVRRSLVPGGRILLHDWLLASDRTAPGEGATLSVRMMLERPGARCYSLAEACVFLRRAGFRSLRTLDRRAILEARR